ncbi:MAG: hypothetical protein K6A93_07200 [Bacteroidaceae bacterium]|nr:hypothetical protein [Bacteroidaceae bacterium]
MNKKDYSAARQGSRRVNTDCSTRVVYDLRKRIQIPRRIRRRLWEAMLPFVTLQLLANMESALLGFDVRVQQLMVDALSDYLSGKGRLFTMIATVDEALGNCYEQIDEFLLEQESRH